MADYPIRPLQLRILQILKETDAALHGAHLRYYIIAGTLLGAVRHGGFIPWDDDIDIAMPRPDYDRLLRDHKKILPPYLELISAETSPGYPFPFGKIQDARTTLIERLHLPWIGGVYIDVFPLDGVPGHPLRRRLHFTAHEYRKRLLYFLYRDPYRHGHGPSAWPYMAARRLYDAAKVQAAIRRSCTATPYDTSRLVVDHDDGLAGVMPRDIFGTPAPITFEGLTLSGPEHPDQYLTRKYGDYMTPPPPPAQRQHNFHYLDLDTPYRQSFPDGCHSASSNPLIGQQTQK